MQQLPQKVFLVSHTHWDREWYLTFHEFRVQLANVVRQVLDRLEHEPEFEHFVLDGQAIILEDYLQVHPEDRERLAKHVRAGALSVGPWYILPDEFLISSEAHVRNLIHGHKVARGFGPVQSVGYMPDSFGHIAQMPQILRQAGLDSFIYTRGNGDEFDDLGFEFTWRAPDGSEVLAINQCAGYCNAGGLGYEELWHAHTQRQVEPARAVEQVRELFGKMAEHSRSRIYLLNNGCDHFPPQRDFPRVLDALRRAFPQTQFQHGSFREFVDTLQESDLETRAFSGELRGGRLHPILSGVWSARMYLKQHNELCQTLLADVLEPLSAYAHFILGQTYPQGELEYAWKLLLQNHPHDSICGCSTDEVHREMEPRFAAVQQTAEQLLRGQLQRMTPTFARQAQDDRETLLCVANPSPIMRSEVIERLVVLQPLDYALDRLQLCDESGEPVPFEILEVRFVERFWGIDYRMQLDFERQQEKFRIYLERFADRILRSEAQANESDCFLTIQFMAREVPAVGHKQYRLLEESNPARSGSLPVGGTRGPRAKDPVHAGERSSDRIENEYYEVRMHPSGMLDVLHKESGSRFHGLNRLDDGEDIGDEYDYSPCRNPENFTTAGLSGSVELLQRTSFRAVLEACCRLELPEGIANDRSRRSAQRLACDIRIRVRLDQGSPIIALDVWFENRVEDHRLQAVFPTGIASSELISDGHFHLDRRSAPQPVGNDWVQPPSQTFPQQEFSLVQGGGRGLAILNRGLPEIAMTQNEAGHAVVALTLLRCVGWLSRDDFETRRCSNAGPTLYTPEAQCKGLQHFSYGLIPFAGSFIDAGIKEWSQRYRAPLPVVQGVVDQHLPGGQGLVRQTSKHTRITAIKKHEERDTLIVRLFNLTGEDVGETLQLGCDLVKAWRTNLLEERQSELHLESKRQLKLNLGRHQVVTLELQLERA